METTMKTLVKVMVPVMVVYIGAVVWLTLAVDAKHFSPRAIQSALLLLALGTSLVIILVIRRLKKTGTLRPVDLTARSPEARKQQILLIWAGIGASALQVVEQLVRARTHPHALLDAALFVAFGACMFRVLRKVPMGS